jgi:uncharacterized RDD family membrane protein YckC
MATRHLSEEPLRVAEALRGEPLASPSRRLLALLVDGLLTIIPTFVVVTALALLALRIADPPAFRALPAIFGHGPEHPAPPEALADFAPLLVHLHAPGLPPEVAAAAHRGDRAALAAILSRYSFDFALTVGEHAEKEARPGTIRVQVEDLIPEGVRALAMYGVMGLYFGLLTAGRRGQTLGKRLLGIRVVRLDGHRLSKLESIERFVGYLHIPGSLGLSLLDLWRDPNRRMAHDRVAHTVVIRVPRVRATSAPDPPGDEQGPPGAT